jgi:hypothetical protein
LRAVLLASLVFWPCLLAVAPAASAMPKAEPAPEFPSLDPEHWVGTPVSLRELRGKVVLLDVWTFG